ncbi:hypothetical protein PV04_09368 [Phialophora macrospora]|uniref:Uncharacterized protein n=1 Tax=Phialophora macrospora TaxID=1851006 RepID=A0A0D2CGZ2_9EURO|nr:hypothetical protein PV04_09368 [Phialophora macrospora]
MDQPFPDPPLINACLATASNPSRRETSNTTFSTSFSSARKANDAELAEAIRLSLQDQQTSPRPSRLPVESGPNKLPLDLVLHLNNEFNALNQPDGDTAIYFGAPPQEAGQSDRDYQYIKHHFDRVHVLDSKTLRLMGDESKFTDDDLLKSTKSFRAERRLRKEHRNVLQEAETKRGGKFRYYIDLRPPREDEEAVILITELTCTRGVLTWDQAKEHYNLAPVSVLGHELGGNPPAQGVPQQANPSATVQETPTDPSTGAANPLEPARTSENAPTPSTPKPSTVAADYSALRHHSALERLLQAINGNDPKLDSAPKTWTFFALARYFGCAAHERISRWITTWIYADNNVNFIQNNPEVAYRIAMGIRSPDLLKDSFSILVSERALIEAYGEHRSEILTPLRQNVHGRKLELLDDDERNRIDHAASSLVKRIREIISHMCERLSFLQESAMYDSLDKIIANTPKETELLMSAKRTIKDYVRSRIYYILCQDQKPFAELEQNVASTLRFRSATADSFSEVYNTLNRSTRPFTKTFWLALQRTQFDICPTNTASGGTTGLGHDTQHTLALKALYMEQPMYGITEISRAVLDNKIVAVNRMLYKQEIAKSHGMNSFEPSVSGMSLAVARDPTDLALDKLAIEIPPRGTLSRPAEEESSPTKRRKTSGVEEFIDFSWDGGSSAPSFSDSAPTKKVSFATSPSSFYRAQAAECEDVSDMFMSSPVGGTAPLVSEEGRDTGSPSQSYGNPAYPKPSWTSIDGRLTLQAGKATTALSTGQSTLALRQKPMEMDASGLTQSRMGVQQPEEQQPAVEHAEPAPTLATAWARKYAAFLTKCRSHNSSSTLPDCPEPDPFAMNITERASLPNFPSLAPSLKNEADVSGIAGRFRWREAFNPGPGIGDGVDSGSNTATATIERPSLEARIVSGNPTEQTAGSSSYHQNPFNGFRNVESMPQQPLQLTSGNSSRTVLQAFSNSNTPGQANSPSNPYKSSAHTASGNRPFYPVNPEVMLQEIGAAVGNICSSILYPPYLFHQTGLLPTDLFDSVLNLNENEFRYLPLWAPDGNDDGSGGVFDETPVPNLDPDRATFESFGPGRIRRPYDQVDSVMSNSDIEEISSSQAISTVGRASKLATDGTHTVTNISSDASMAGDPVDADAVIVSSASDLLGADSVDEGVLRRDSAGDSLQSDLETEIEVKELDGDDDDATDTINGDDHLEKEMTASLRAFIAGDGDDDDDNDEDGESACNKRHNSVTMEAEQAVQAQELNAKPVNPALFHTAVGGEVEVAVEVGGTGEGNGKGKAKAQNHPFFPHSDLEHYGQIQHGQPSRQTPHIRHNATLQFQDEDEYEFI